MGCPSGLQDFWRFCKQCKVPTPYLNMAKIDCLFIKVNEESANAPHNPKRAFVEHEFIAGVVRLSVPCRMVGW